MLTTFTSPDKSSLQVPSTVKSTLHGTSSSLGASPVGSSWRKRRHVLIRRYLRQSLPHAQFYRFKHFWQRKTPSEGLSQSFPPLRNEATFHVLQAQSFWQSVGFALEGLRFVYETQRNVRIDCAIVLITCVLGVMVSLSVTQWVVLLVSQGMLLMAEVLNTLLEWWIDWQTKGQWDLRAKRLKDVSAGLCLLNACVVGLVMLSVFMSKVAS